MPAKLKLHASIFSKRHMDANGYVYKRIRS